MRVLIATSEPSIAHVLSTLLRRSYPDAHLIVIDDLAGLDDRAGLAIVAVNSLTAGDRSPEERIERVLARVSELTVPVIALVGWPEDGEERARAAGVRAVLPMPLDVGALLRAIEAVPGLS